MPEVHDNAKQYGLMVAKYWSDEDYKKRLLEDPATAMKELGIEVPEGVEVRIVVNTGNVHYVAIPEHPPEELSEETLAQVAGGYTTLGTMACICFVTVGTVACGTIPDSGG